MANIPNANQYRTRTNPTAPPSTRHPPATPDPPGRSKAGGGAVLATLVVAGVLYLMGGLWAAVIGGVILAALLFASDD